MVSTCAVWEIYIFLLLKIDQHFQIHLNETDLCPSPRDAVNIGYMKSERCSLLVEKYDILTSC